MKPRPSKATEKEIRAELHPTRAPRLKGKVQHARLKADMKKKQKHAT